MLPYVTSPACSAMSKLSAGLPAAVSVALSASIRASISRAAASAAGVTTATFAPSGGRNTASTPSPKNLRISPPAARTGFAETVEDAVKTPGYLLGRRLLSEVGKAAHVSTENGSSDPADGAALHLPGTDAVGRIVAEIGREQVV